MTFLSGLATYALTIFGVGFVIFFHELGHYLAARATGVRVEAFSIGFGPRLFGFRKGPTDYFVSLIPIGGYVKMAGEDPTSPREGREDEFASKSVPRRILVIVAGVVMNVVFAVLAPPLAFMWGVPVRPPILGSVELGGPAWEAGLRRGDRIVEAAGSSTLSFEDAAMSIIAGGADVPVVYERDGVRAETIVRPRVDREAGAPFVGIDAAASFDPIPKGWIDPDAKEGLPEAVRAAAGFAEGDVVRSIDGLPASEWARSTMKHDLIARFEERRVSVRRGDAVVDLVVPPVRAPETEDVPPRFGIVFGSTRIVEVSKLGSEKLGLKAGDRIAAVGGRRVGTRADVLRAAAARSPVELDVVDRDGAERRATIADAGAPALLANEVVFDSAAHTASPEAGGPAARAGVEAGDVLVSIDGVPATAEDLARTPVDAAAVSVEFRRERAGAATIVKATMTREILAPNVALAGLALASAETEIVRAGFVESWGLGFAYVESMTRRVLSTIKSIFTRRVSGKNLGGVITIFRESAAMNERSPSSGLLFMAFISVNLAVLNILPIPVLDGGWLVFLLIEAARKKPAPERAVAIANTVGLVLLLALMLYATWNDVVRWLA
jgi:regulator of sigma E protease